jgi:glycosyltransferase involved in cell wall biosynthesis
VLDARVLPWHHRPVIHRYNTWSLTRTIRRALQDLGVHTRPVLVTGSPPSVGVVGRLAEQAAIYFCMDDFLQLPTTSPGMLAPLEARMLERVDAVVATAESLTRSKRPSSGRVYYLPQGVNYEHFATPRPLPAELQTLPRPIVGFAGAFYDRCDFELMRQLADANSGGSLVVVGPVIDDPAPILRPNVHVLGPRPYRELPAYVQAFDVGVVPYVLNEETRAVDPLKLLEYLAAGIPVVTTALPEVRKYGSAVSIAPTRREFVEAVLRVLGSPQRGTQERQSVARRHGWVERADQLLGIVADVVARQSVVVSPLREAEVTPRR